MHAEYTIRALKAGKHVLCEKPMANSAADCEKMIAAAKAASKKLMVAYRCRYEPNNQLAIRRAQDSSEGPAPAPTPGQPAPLGMGPTRVIIAEMGFNIGNPGQWRLKKAMAGGGSMMDIGIYGLNAARYLTGEEPTEVYAMLSTTPNDVRFAEVEENITFQLRFPSGILANCVSSYGTSFNKFRVNKKLGAFELDPATPYTGLRMRVFRGNNVEDRSLPQRDHFQLEMDHFSECVQANKEPLTPGEEGLKDMRIIEAIYESARRASRSSWRRSRAARGPRGRVSGGRVRFAGPDLARPGRQHQRIHPHQRRAERDAGADGAAPPGRERQHHRQRQHQAGRIERVGNPRGWRRPFRGHAGADGGAERRPTAWRC